jgi:DNA-binding transcriptional ArsR family regulator
VTDEPDKGSQERIEALLVKALGHPLRAKLLFALNDAPGKSAQEIAERVGEPVRKVRHHLSELRKAGLIEAVEHRTRRGVVEQFYSVAKAPMVDDAKFAKLSSNEKLRIVTQALKRCYELATEALIAGTFYARDETGLVTVQAELDSQGWREFVEAHRRAHAEVERVKAESGARLRGGAERPIGAASTLMWFEMPTS